MTYQFEEFLSNQFLQKQKLSKFKNSYDLTLQYQEATYLGVQFKGALLILEF